MIPYGRQSISEDDINAVVEVLRSDWLTQGPTVEKFEQALCEYTDVRYSVAVSSGTAALHLACLALSVGPGDTVWTSPISFVASANCALYCGAKIDFVDIDPLTINMSVEKLEEKLFWGKQHNCLPKVVIPVHFAGQSCNMRRIRELSNEYGFYIVEDACHALGGAYKGKKVGNCEYSDICVFSFHPVKNITTGEGGAALTNDSKLAEKLRLLRTHGITKNPDEMQGETHGSWYYQQIGLGYHYRITDLQCALGYSQLKRLDDFVSKRNSIAAKYTSAFVGLPLKLPYVQDDCYSAFHIYTIQIDHEKSELNRKVLFDYLRESGIGVNVHFIPIPTQPYYKSLGYAGEFPAAVAYYESAISLPIFPDLHDVGLYHVIETMKSKLLSIDCVAL